MFDSHRIHIGFAGAGLVSVCSLRALALCLRTSSRLGDRTHVFGYSSKNTKTGVPLRSKTERETARIVFGQRAASLPDLYGH
eukprot:318931-Prorocentrum_minimum.AAC.1